MSVRADPEEHVRVRGIMVSTLRLAPSLLPVRCVERWGMPNQHGIVVCDDVIIHIQYDRTRDELIRAWAQPQDHTHTERRDETGSSCVVS